MIIRMITITKIIMIIIIMCIDNSNGMQASIYTI